ncbi:MAG: hypothetical protein AB7V16_07285 [Vulcanibacillus sp.]
MINIKDLDIKSYAGGEYIVINKILRKAYNRDVDIIKFNQYMNKSGFSQYIILMSEGIGDNIFFTTQVYNEDGSHIKEQLDETLKDALTTLKAFEKQLRVKEKNVLVENIITLKAGQKVIAENGNIYEIEKGDMLGKANTLTI